MGMAGFQAEMESNGDGKEMEAPWDGEAAGCF
jgi:hypothetical protein